MKAIKVKIDILRAHFYLSLLALFKTIVPRTRREKGQSLSQPAAFAQKDMEGREKI